jgi:Spy/CpxP family protein refolding chaperone
MKSRLLYLGLAFSVSLNLAIFGAIGWQFAHAQTQGSAMPLEGSGQGQAVAALNLTSSQQQQWDQLREQFKQERSTHRARVAQLKQQLVSALLTSNSFNKSEIESLLSAVQQEQAQFQYAVVQRILAERALLTSDQLPSFQKLLVHRLMHDGTGLRHFSKTPPANS